MGRAEAVAARSIASTIALSETASVITAMEYASELIGTLRYVDSILSECRAVIPGIIARVKEENAASLARPKALNDAQDDFNSSLELYKAKCAEVGAPFHWQLQYLLLRRGGDRSDFKGDGIEDSETGRSINVAICELTGVPI